MSHPRRGTAMLTRALRIAALLALAATLSPIALGAQTPGGPIPEPIASKLFDGGAGFMWGMSGGSFVMARTQDSGKTWSVLDLAALSIDLGALSVSSNGARTPVSVHFEDPGHGWLVWSTDDSLLHIANTADGGSTWQDALSLPTDAVLRQEAFPGPGRACITAEMAEGMMRSTMVILATDDDGATWTSSSLDQGDGVRSLVFRNATDGFLSVYYPSGVRILFYRTGDGGKTWQGLDIPLPAGMEEPGGTVPGAPVFSGPELLIGQLTVQISLPEGWTKVSYRSADGGKTWSPSN